MVTGGGAGVVGAGGVVVVAGGGGVLAVVDVGVPSPHFGHVAGAGGNPVHVFPQE
jgi:hypothetical protein